MAKLNASLQILDLRDAVANANPAECETLERRSFGEGLKRKHKKQCLNVDWVDLGKTKRPIECTDPPTHHTEPEGCEKSKKTLVKSEWKGCSSSKDGLNADSFIKAVCKYPPLYYAICVREEEWRPGAQANPEVFHQNPCVKDTKKDEKVTNFEPVCQKEMTCRPDSMSPDGFQCGTIEEEIAQKQNENAEERLLTGPTYNIKCPVYTHLTEIGVAKKTSFFSSSSGCYMLLKSYPSLSLNWTNNNAPPKAFSTYTHAAATCRQWHPDAKILRLSDFQEYLIINEFVKRELGSPTAEERKKYNFLLRNNHYDDLITVVCSGGGTGMLLRYRLAEISRHFNDKRKHSEKERLCTFWGYGLGKCGNEFISDMLMSTKKAPCTDAFGLICEYIPECPINVKEKPNPVPRSKQVCKRKKWPQFRSHHRSLKRILKDNGISTHDTI